MASALRIFLSSTYSDLAPYRRAIEELVKEYGELFSGMEYFGARSQRPIDVCLQEVAAANVVLVLVGARYGSLTDDGRSYTHREVEHARTNGVTVFVLVQDNPEEESQSEVARREKFLRWLGAYYTFAHFADTTQLVTKASAALRRVDMDGSLSEDKEPWKEIIQRADSAADWDCVAVTAHNLDRVYSVDLVSPDYETRITSPIVTAGGSGANTVAGLGRLGLQVAAAGLVADDDDGEFLRRALTEDRVKPLLAPTRGVTLRTGSTIAFADPGGRRSIFVNPGANEQFAAAAKDRGYRSDLRSAIRSTRILHYSSFTLAPERSLQETLLKELPARAILSLTPGALYCKLGLDRLAVLLGRANVLFLYEQQLDSLLEQGTDSLGTRTSLRDKMGLIYEWKREHRYHEPLVLVIKNAKGPPSTVPRQLRGGVGRTRLEVNQPTQASIGSPVEIRDSIGAGDGAAAGMLWAILQKESFNYALDVAYVVARSSSSEYGGRAGLPTVMQLHRRWKSWIRSPHRI